ncbi:MAG: 16S rRNA (guanine(966)-N(2))-methyltransferase RsmD [Chlamydiae bacterium]|nr:16S rRNA (guanine(966)-N(2))-methyltransferase RsmD [Chlamydiota bacterium]MBI3278148.1 16S rRNA (guanine(966)-N(2))-methyltransferase RsmD [Chlamydiota bacterium]
MRIIAGLAKGRLLKTLPGDTVRPTADRVRESIFNILDSHIMGADILDLFAGSGALGLESLSRGAEASTFVEKSKRASLVIRENFETLHFQNSQILTMDVFKSLSFFKRREKFFDLVFADPPYSFFKEIWIQDLWKGVSQILSKEGIFVVEHPSQWSSVKMMDSLEQYDIRQYGQTSVSFYKKGEIPSLPQF